MIVCGRKTKRPDTSEHLSSKRSTYRRRGTESCLHPWGLRGKRIRGLSRVRSPASGGCWLLGVDDEDPVEEAIARKGQRKEGSHGSVTGHGAVGTYNSESTPSFPTALRSFCRVGRYFLSFLRVFFISAKKNDSRGVSSFSDFFNFRQGSGETFLAPKGTEKNPRPM